MERKGIVEYFSHHEGYKCGYCRSEKTCYSHGMWAHKLTPLNYQNLIDRGWRRSGKYCYKPTMSRTCCPLYTIRCEALNFTLTKSQKKVLKRVHKFLAYGKEEKAKQDPSSSTKNPDEGMEIERPQEIDVQSYQQIKKIKTLSSDNITEMDNSALLDTKKDLQAVEKETCDKPSSSHCSPSHSNHTSETGSPLKSNNVSNSAPQCRKAKFLRQERKKQKLLNKGMSVEEASASLKKKSADPKTIEDFLNEPLPPNPAHKLQLRLVPSSLENPQFSRTYEESYSLYKKYQMTIHGDPEEKCSTKQYLRFLVKNPFQNSQNTQVNSPKFSCGSYHQQYWLDDKLIAVGVIDILPYCLSSVYFYYDPDYSFLSLGTYAALREIAFTREFNKKYLDLKYYYMGFYIHSCIKMRYKGQYVPSFLLCPETYTFHPIEECKKKLDVTKYNRLEDDLTKEDTEGEVILHEVRILYDSSNINYDCYQQLKRDTNTDEEEVKQYANFVGKKCYRNILLYRE